MKHTSRTAMTAFIFLLLVSPIFAADTNARGKYNSIEVLRFEVKEGVNLLPDFAVTLVEDLIKEFQASGKFKQVLREGEKADVADAKVLRLTGTVTEFDPGSRAKRYLVGFGAGKTKLVANIKVLDAATGTSLYETKADGRVWIGAFGGEAIGATRGLAKEVVKKTTEKFFTSGNGH